MCYYCLCERSLPSPPPLQVRVRGARRPVSEAAAAATEAAATTTTTAAEVRICLGGGCCACVRADDGGGDWRRRCRPSRRRDSSLAVEVAVGYIACHARQTRHARRSSRARTRISSPLRARHHRFPSPPCTTGTRALQRRRRSLARSIAPEPETRTRTRIRTRCRARTRCRTRNP